MMNQENESVQVPIIRVDPNKHLLYQTIANTLVSILVIVSSTYLASIGNLTSETWVGAVGAALAVNGGVTVVQSKRTNGNGHAH